jgi:uncharacterized damage-inducible protein DinB
LARILEPFEMPETSAFTRLSADYLQRTYLPRLVAALKTVPDARLWSRPHADTTSPGVLLRHLDGNVRQWILSGIAGRPDDRDRAAEFAAPPRASKEVILASLRATVEEAAGVIASLDDAALHRTYRIQGFEVAGLEAVYHVVEHFAWHVGQIVWMAKSLGGEGHGIAFYDDEAINRARND